jgi:hypothetical protein
MLSEPAGEFGARRSVVVDDEQGILTHHGEGGAATSFGLFAR